MAESVARGPLAPSAALILLGVSFCASACELERTTPKRVEGPRGIANAEAPSAGGSAAESSDRAPRGAAGRGQLVARPGRPKAPLGASGKIALGLGTTRDGFLYVPGTVAASEPAPLVVFFHGAGGNAGQAEMIRPFADRDGVLVLAIDSRGSTWDVIEGEIGPDFAFLDRALAWTFERFSVDASRVAASGFSDGASYALSAALANGELFRSVLAFSPGFMAAPAVRGQPRVFISHGTKDGVLPIDRCSREIVARLRRSGYSVEYREFEGGHSVPSEIASGAFEWLRAQR